MKAQPDVVLCDIGLPGMDGYAIASGFRKTARWLAHGWIAVTGYGQEEDNRMPAGPSGNDGFLDPLEIIISVQISVAFPGWGNIQ